MADDRIVPRLNSQHILGSRSKRIIRNLLRVQNGIRGKHACVCVNMNRNAISLNRLGKRNCAFHCILIQEDIFGQNEFFFVLRHHFIIA